MSSQKKYKVLIDYVTGVKRGDVVYDIKGYDYGVSMDDTRISGIPHISVTYDSDGDYPFMTIPVEYLQEIIND